MKKTIIGLAVLAMSIMPAVAATQNQSSDNSVKIENARKGNFKGDKSKKDKKDRKGIEGKEGKQCKEGKKCKDGKQMCKGKKGECKKIYNDSVNFESLNLNDTQKAKIKALNDARRSSARELRENARKARAAGDTSFVFDGSQVEVLQSKYLKDLREVLTADQYVQFLENNYVKNSVGQKGMGPKMGKGTMKGAFGKDNRMIEPAKKEMKAKMGQKQATDKAATN